jgi:tetratricopeptide (TPR) repeat protein
VVIGAALIVLSAMLTAASSDAGKKEFERAMTYFDAGEYEAALPLFQKAYENSGHRPSTIRALAQCERALKMYDPAITHFREYLATDPQEAVAIVETVRLLEELRSIERTNKAKEPPPEKLPEVREAPAPEPEPAADPKLTVETTAPVTEEEDSSWIWWVAVGAAGVIAGGIGLGLALSGEEDPYGGTRGVVLRGR